MTNTDSVRLIRVLIAQNYSLAWAEKTCLDRESPSQHLWGLDIIRGAGMEASVLKQPAFTWLRWLTRLTRVRFGDFSRQLTLLREARASRVNVIICAEMGFARGLGLLRRWRILRIPLVGLLHPYEPRSRLSRYAAGGFDQVLCLSSRILDVMDGEREDKRYALAHWGPDLNFDGYRPQSGTAVVSTGRTHRDLGLLARAAAKVACPLIVHNRVANAPSADRVEKLDAGYADVLDDLKAAAVVAIPLSRTDGSFGLTELNDALALGKPVLMTRNPYIDVDIEAIGCGRWLEPHDEDGWSAALAELMGDPDLRRTMGAKARAFADSSWNYRLFGEVLVRAVTRAGT